MGIRALAILMLGASAAEAQQGQVEWLRQRGTAASESGSAAAVGPSGEIYVAGGAQGAIDGQTHSGASDILLVKYSAAGVWEWTRLLGTAGDEAARDVAVDSSGGVYVAGTTNGNLDGQTNAGGYDVFLCKYDSAGNLLWTRLRGGTDTDRPRSLAVTAAGVHLAGETASSFDGETNAGPMDLFAMKFDLTGNWQWTRFRGTIGGEIGYGVAVGPSGEVYVTGIGQASLDGQTVSGGLGDMILVKWDSAGVWQWTRLLGTAGIDEGYGLAVAGGAVYVVGHTDGNLDGQTNTGDWDIFLTRYSAAGVKDWTRLRGSTVREWNPSVTIDPAGRLCVSATTNGSPDGQANAGGQDAALFVFSAAGTWEFTTLLGTASNDGPGRLSAVPSLPPRVALAGWSGGAMPGGGGSAGGDDSWCAVVRTAAADSSSDGGGCGLIGPELLLLLLVAQRRRVTARAIP
jgi:hypothetical protein